MCLYNEMSTFIGKELCGLLPPVAACTYYFTLLIVYKIAHLCTIELYLCIYCLYDTLKVIQLIILKCRVSVEVVCFLLRCRRCLLSLFTGICKKVLSRL